MSYLERLKHLETHQWPTDKTDKTTFVSSVSSMQARIERAASIQQAGTVATVAVAIPSSPKAAPPHEPATDARLRRAAMEAAAVVRRDVTDLEEREVVDWLERIGEPDPVVFGETLAKCRTNPTYKAAFLNMARGDDAGTVN